MKKLFYIATILMAACTMSLDKKADSLIQDEMKKTLFHPESYDPIETIVDSAFAPDNDPALFERIAKIIQIGSEIESLEDEANNYRSTISIFSGPYVSEFGKNQKAEAQSKLDKTNAEIERQTSKAQKVGDEIKSMLSSDKKFIGFKANHSYRAKNNMGNVLLGRSIFIIDEPLEKIIFSCASEDYEQLQEAIEMIKERIAEKEKQE